MLTAQYACSLKPLLAQPCCPTQYMLAHKACKGCRTARVSEPKLVVAYTRAADKCWYWASSSSVGDGSASLSPNMVHINSEMKKTTQIVPQHHQCMLLCRVPAKFRLGQKWTWSCVLSLPRVMTTCLLYGGWGGLPIHWPSGKTTSGSGSGLSGYLSESCCVLLCESCRPLSRESCPALLTESNRALPVES